MGNCIVLHHHEEVIRVVKPDGVILEYKAPRKVCHVLSEFVGHAISDSHLQPVIRHLHPYTDMVPGHKYYLLPLPEAPPASTEKKGITFPKPDVGVAAGTTGGVVRIKLIISKQELQAMLQKGEVTVDDMINEFQKKEIRVDDDDEMINTRRWKPKLETIPELN